MPILRRCLERVSRHLVLRRRLPARFGGRRLWVTPGAALAYFRSLDSNRWNDLFDFAEHWIEPNDCVWDVGANLGVFAFAAAHRSGPGGNVLAIEPDPWLAELARRSGSEPMPAAAPVAVLCAAVAEENTLQMFVTTARARSGSHLASVAGSGDDLVGRAAATHPVVTITLDWLLRHQRGPDVLKIDVEGAELSVLRGAQNLLKKHRPKVLLEVYDQSADEVTRLLQAHGYQLFDFTAGQAGRRPVARAVYHTLALPRPD